MDDGHDREPGGPLPDRLPRWAGWAWQAWEAVTWPATAWRLRRAGFTRAGWRTWVAGPPGGAAPAGDPWGDGFATPPEPVPPCYRAAIGGITVHEPGCRCPP